jgi:hypothetical protein
MIFALGQFPMLDNHGKRRTVPGGMAKALRASHSPSGCLRNVLSPLARFFLGTAYMVAWPRGDAMSL